MSRSGTRAKRALKPIGALPTSEALEVIAAAGDPRARKLKARARGLRRDVKFENFLGFGDHDTPAYKYTEHQFGFFATAGDNHPATTDIADAAAMPPDLSLQNQQLLVTLDRLRVCDYPGDGRHVVLVDFSADHSTTAGKQELHFSHKYAVLEGQGAGIRGYPIFGGLRCDAQGVAFQVSTVNVENDDDQKILAFMDSDVLKKGLSLVNTINPAIPVVTSLVSGIVGAFASRHKNIVVQSFYLGLDFTKVQSRARLREGTYVCVQAPEEGWDWSQWRWNRARGTIESVAAPPKPIPYNYLVIGVSRLLE
jgi:hypothetical protein